MDAVIIYSNYITPLVNGSLINAFEYYIAIREWNPKQQLVFVNFSEVHEIKLRTLFQTRYSNLPQGYAVGISFIKRSEVILKKFDRVLALDYSTMRDLKGLINAEEYYVISERYTHEAGFFWDYPKRRVHYFNEMPFEYGDQRYKMKMLFDYFPKVETVEDNIYISSPDFASTSLGKTKDVLRKELIDRIGREDKKILLKGPDHSKNLFSTFSELYYVKMYGTWDCHPRFMHEAAFYGKKVHYINDNDLVDGSYYRFKDLSENGLKGRDFSSRDAVIERFL